MKKFTIAFLFFWILVIPQMFAQTQSTLVSKVGPKAGLNITTLSNGLNTDAGFSMKMGLNAGVVLNLHWGQRYLDSPYGTGKFGLQPEILFSSQGAQMDDDKINLNYLTVPIMFKYYPTSKLYFELGPELAYMLSESPQNVDVNNAMVIYLDEVKGGMDVLLGVGAGYELSNGLTVGARYNYGCSDLAKNLPWSNQVIQVSLSWLFTL